MSNEINNPNGWVLGAGAHAKVLWKNVLRVAAAQCSVLITGPTGSGKEIVARLIAASGPRAQKEFVAVNCPATPATLVESIFFGHNRGSFTGAVKDTVGVFGAADQGILFLDEVGELSIDVQPKLLRALETRQITRVGESGTTTVDVQVISATNRDLDAEILAGRFREDLHFRLNTVTLKLLPLCERLEDMRSLVEHFCRRFELRYQKDEREIEDVTISRLQSYDWPGNIRELSHVIERAYVLDTAIDPPQSRRPKPTLPTLRIDELRVLAAKQALALTGGNISAAASLLGVGPGTVRLLIPDLPRRRYKKRVKSGTDETREPQPSLNGAPT